MNSRLPLPTSRLSWCVLSGSLLLPLACGGESAGPTEVAAGSGGTTATLPNAGATAAGMGGTEATVAGTTGAGQTAAGMPSTTGGAGTGSPSGATGAAGGTAMGQTGGTSMNAAGMSNAGGTSGMTGSNGGAAAMPSAGSDAGMTAGAAGSGMMEPQAGASSTVEPEPMAVGTVCPADFGTPPTGNLDASLVEGVEPPDYNFHLYEGPVWVDGALYFSDIDPNPWNSTIRKYVPGSGMATDFLVGAASNGLAVGADGTLYSATAGKKEISVYDLGAGTQMTAVAGTFNSPNDLTVASDGTIYFSDPQQGEIAAGNQPQVVHVVKDGVDQIFDDTIASPNGLNLSPDESSLYVITGGYSGAITKVELVDGLAGEITPLVTDLQVPDGATMDCAGNLYVAIHEQQQVWVFDPEGTQFATIQLGNAANGQAAKPTNVAFGGADGKTLYITAMYSLWEIPLQIAGFPN